MKKELTLLSIVLMFAAVMSFALGCNSSNTENKQTVEVVKEPLNSEYLGNVGRGHRGDFNVFRFEVDGVTYIVASEYNGGMALIDKIDNK